LLRTLFTPFHYISSVLVELNDAIVPVTICNEKTSIWGLSDIGRPIKSVWPGAYKTPRTQAQQDTAISIYLSNGVTGLGIVIGSTNWVATPHGFRVTPDGDIWATDYNPQSGHTITKIDTNGRILLRLGARGFIGTGPNTFNGPTDVAQAPDGSFFVADGHWNNRIVKFDKDGRYVMEWGKKGSGQGDLNVPHTIVIDRRGRVLVGDRSNERIQIFNQDGEYLDEWDQFGRPSGMFIDLNDVLYVADYEKLRRVTYGSAEDGTITGFIEGSEPEGIVVDAEGNVYTGEVTGGQGGEGRIIRKFIKQ
jgi:streptogramin lyase